MRLHFRIPVIMVMMLLAVLLAACQTPGGEEATTPPVVGDTSLETPTLPVETDDVTTSPVEDTTLPAGPATPTSIPTQPPSMPVWPLGAHLFYLNNAGQVWRQPLLGDETAAAAVTPLEQEVLDFAVAPGGEWLMYRTDEFIGISAVNGQGGQIIAWPAANPLSDARQRTLAWSPDSSKVAYTTPSGFEVYVPGTGPEAIPFISPIPETPLRELAWSPNGQWLLVWREDGSAALYESRPEIVLWVELGRLNAFVWMRDGRIAFAPEEGGLALLDPTNLDSRVFMAPQDRQISLPGQRTDGTLAFFVHQESVDEPGTLHLGNPEDLSFHQESSVPVDTSFQLWNPTATRLLSLRQGDEPVTEITLLDPATGSSASFEPKGSPIAFDWADPPPASSTGLTLPNDLYCLAPVAGVLQLWRLPKTGNAPEALTDAPSNVIDYDVSADGTQIVYTSGGVIYRKVLGTVDVTEIATLNTQGTPPVTAGTPAFSPNGRQIAYANRGIWIHNLDTGQARRLVADRIPTDTQPQRDVLVYSEPEWSPDGTWLLVRVQAYEGPGQTALLATSGNPRDPIFLSQIDLNVTGSEAEWVNDDLILLFSGGGNYGQPHLSLVEVGQPPTISRVLDMSILDAKMRTDDRIVFLRMSAASGLWPSSVRLYSAASDGSGLRVESPTFVVERAALSPDGVMIAGLVETRYGETGVASGRLVIANPSNGEFYLIEGLSNVRDLQWGEVVD